MYQSSINHLMSLRGSCVTLRSSLRETCCHHVFRNCGPQLKWYKPNTPADLSSRNTFEDILHNSRPQMKCPGTAGLDDHTATPTPCGALESRQCSTTTGCLQRCATCSVALPTKNALIAPMACFFMTCMYDRSLNEQTSLRRV